MQSLSEQLPDMADAIAKGAKAHPALKEALEDFDLAWSRARDERLTSEDRRIWAEIRDEIAVELRRLSSRIV